MTTRLQMSNRKPFSQTLYDNDDSAKDQLIAYLANHRFHNPRVNPDQYGIDVLAERDGQPYAFEVEVKHNWKGTHFPYSTVHFAGRKAKFTDEAAAPIQNTHFVMLNHDRTIALAISGEIIVQAQKVVKETIYTQGEEFISVPKAQAKFFRIET